MKNKYGILVLSGMALLLAAAALMTIYKAHNAQQLVVVTDTSVMKQKEFRLYGLAVDSFVVETGKIGRNQNLGQILQQFNLPERSLTQLLLYAGNVFDVRKMRVGNPYTVFLSKDSLSKLQYLVYEHSPVDYVVFDFRDSVRVSVKQKEITTVQKKIHGEIITSLWDAITQSNINPQVALQLSDIYAWTIDFFGLQPGDNFTVVYDELFVDSASIGLGQIHGASFNHAGRELLAIPFMQDSTLSYFDGDGNSLRRAFLRAPLKFFSRISSRFSNSRMHPILKIRRPHHGVDYAAPIGTPVYTIGDGRVISVGFQDGEGRIVKVRHNGEYTSTYMHLSAFARDIRAGKDVVQGELLGYVGSSGLSTGPHLDFRVYKYGTAIDPLKMESPPVDPVKPQNLQAFNTVKSMTLQILTGSEADKLGEIEGNHPNGKPLLIVR
jgi:murein DD-endopeptidase MepM/ murein hydrolase activator NlpD